jgi:hypothetical protein
VAAPVRVTTYGDGEPGAGTMSCGLLTPSRLVTLIAVELDVVSAKLTGPLPVTASANWTEIQVPAGKAPVLPSVAPGAGAVPGRMDVSLQVLSATAFTAMPVLLADSTKNFSTADDGPPTPCTSKRR